MKYKIVLRLKDLSTALHITVTDEKGFLQQEITPEIMHDSDVYAWIPCVDVLLTEIKLPKLSYSQLMRAIPFALEGRLAEATTDLHFAVDPNANEKLRSVAVVSKAKMEGWLTFINSHFKDNTLHLKSMLPDVLGVPWYPGHWTVLIEGNQALVRMGNQSGFGIDTPLLWDMLKLYLKNITPPLSLIIFSEEEEPVSEADVLFFKKASVTIQYQKYRDFSDLITEAASSPINLLQGKYKHQNRFKINPAQFQKMLIVPVVWLFLLASLFGSQEIALLHQEQHLNKRISTEYSHIFPGTSASDKHAIKDRIQQNWQVLKYKHSNLFLKMMVTVLSAFSKVQGIRLLRLEYLPQHLILIVEAADFSRIDNLTEVLRSQNLTVETSEAIKSSNNVQVNLSIQGISP